MFPVICFTLVVIITEKCSVCNFNISAFVNLRHLLVLIAFIVHGKQRNNIYFTLLKVNIQIPSCLLQR